MSLAGAGWLWVGAVASLLIVALHFIKPKPVRVPVSSLFLWRLADKAIAANQRRSRLQKSLLLAAQLLAVWALALALARPFAPAALGELRLAVVLDASASMAVVDDGESSRWERALREIERVLNRVEAGRYDLYASTAPHPLYEGESKDELLAAARAIRAPAGASDWNAALDALSAKAQAHTPFRAIIVTDGAVHPDALAGVQRVTPHADVSVISIGEPVGNVAITAFTARPVGGDPWRHQALIRVANFSDAPVEAPVSVVASVGSPPVRREVYAQTVALAPHERRDIVVDHAFSPGESLAVTVDFDDPFPVDNAAYLTSQAPQTTRIRLVGPDIPFLNAGISAFAHARVETGASLEGEEEDLVIIAGTPTPEATNARAAAAFALRGDAGDPPPQITWWDKAHPLSRFVDWGSVRLLTAAPLVVEAGERVLVDSTAGPLVAVLERDEARRVRVGIPLLESDFPYRVAFVVFLYNVLQWAHPQAVQLAPEALPPGSLPLEARRLMAGGSPLRLILENDAGGHWAASAGAASFPVEDIDRPGVYAWRAGDRSGRFAISLLDEEESDLSPRLAQGLAAYGIAETALALAADVTEKAPSASLDRAAPRRERWRHFAALALAAMALESSLDARMRRRPRNRRPFFAASPWAGSSQSRSRSDSQ